MTETFHAISANTATSKARRRGFTLIELLVVISIIAILAAMLLPVITRAKLRAQGIACMSNTKQLATGWIMYLNDNQDELIPNPGWAAGSTMTWGSSLDNIDTGPLLTNSTDAMGYYVKSASVYKCPSDIYQSKDNPGPHVRSVSMNGGLGGSTPTVKGTNPDNRQYYGSGGAGSCTKMSQLKTPGPAMVYVVLDEQADSICALNGDATYAFDPGPSINSEQWRDLPASYHNNCGSFSFADGHSELHRWLVTSGNNKTTYLVTMTTYGASGAPWKNTQGHSEDFEWVQDRMPYR